VFGNWRWHVNFERIHYQIVCVCLSLSLSLLCVCVCGLTAPMMVSTLRPSLNRISVGMLRMPYSVAVSCQSISIRQHKSAYVSFVCRIPLLSPIIQSQILGTLCMSTTRLRESCIKQSRCVGVWRYLVCNRQIHARYRHIHLHYRHIHVCRFYIYARVLDAMRAYSCMLARAYKNTRRRSVYKLKPDSRHCSCALTQSSPRCSSGTSICMCVYMYTQT